MYDIINLPWAAPDRSTPDASEVKVDISQGKSSSKLDSPIPLTMAPKNKKILIILKVYVKIKIQ